MTRPVRRRLFARHSAARPEKKRRNWFAPSKFDLWLWRNLKRFCMMLGAMVLISGVASCVMISSMLNEGSTPATLPDQMVLYMALHSPYPEHNEFNMGRQTSPTLLEVLDALEAARDDKRIKGVVASLRGAAFGPAQLYELREGIKKFRESGKFAYFYTGSFAEQGQGIGSYYLASAFQEIWMQPTGAVTLPGLKAEVPFARGLLDKVGVTPDVFTRKEYKNVFESFTADSMGDSSREVLTAVIGEMALFIRGQIAADRGIKPHEMQAFIDRGLLLDTEALDAKLIDKIDYITNMSDKIKEDITGDPRSEDVKFVTIGRYSRNNTAHSILREKARMTKKTSTEKPKIALVYAIGTIMPESPRGGNAGPLAFIGGSPLSASDFSQIMHGVIDDDDIEIVVLRIDSPGGSPMASETMRSMLLRAQSRGKKIIVSMGESAASGGYWLATPADRIFATPMTMTGSIGVAGGKFVLEGLWEKIGVNWDGVEWGESAGMWSANQPFNDHDRERYGAMMDAVYAGFVQRVAEGRKLTPAQAEDVARGRVWLGSQAARNGLVDELGGLTTALDYAATLAGAENRKGVTVAVMPQPKSMLDRVIQLLEMQVGIGKWFGSVLSSARMAAQADTMMLYEPLKVR